MSRGGPGGDLHFQVPNLDENCLANCLEKIRTLYFPSVEYRDRMIDVLLYIHVIQ